MWTKNQKDEEKQIKRLKDILFPKKKNTEQQCLNLINFKDIYQIETKRQPNSLQKASYLTKFRQNKNNQKYTRISNLDLAQDQTSCIQIQEQCQNHDQEFDSHKNSNINQEKIIKSQITNLRQQINLMLSKWDDPTQQIKSQNQDQVKNSQPKYLELKKEFDRKQFFQQRQDETRMHYLQNIQEISNNCQRYNGYVYGIKEATQQMLDTIPVKNQYLMKNPHSQTCKLYFLGNMLLNFFSEKISYLKVKLLKRAFQQIKSYYQTQKQNDIDQRNKKLLNKGDFLFLRKNFLDKAFKKWRLKNSLLKFSEALNQFRNNQLSSREVGNSKALSDSDIQKQDKDNTILVSEYLLKNSLQKQKVVYFLQKLLQKQTQQRSGSSPNQQSSSMGFNQEVQILLFDSINSQMSSYVSRSNLEMHQNNQSIVNSRLNNVLKPLEASKVQNPPYDSQCFGKVDNLKKYTFAVKNSLTKMCIDCKKILRIPEIKRNQVYRLQVDGSVNEQLWIQSSKTHRSNLSPTQLKDRQLKQNIQKKTYLAEQVFYEGEQLQNVQSYRYSCPKVKVSAIFYPLIHKQNLIGLVRQYIYHQSSISLQTFEIAAKNIQTVMENIFTVFCLSNQFGKLRRENQIIEKKHALKVLKAIKNIQSCLENLIGDYQQQERTQVEIIQAMISSFQNQIRTMFNFCSRNFDNRQNSLKLLVFKSLSNKDKQNNSKSSLFFRQQDLKQTKIEALYVPQKSNLVKNNFLLSIVQEFHQESINKDSNAYVFDGNFNEQWKALSSSVQQTSYCKVLMIKPQQVLRGESVYFVFIEDGNQSTRNEDDISRNIELMMGTANKFIQILNSGLKKREDSKELQKASVKNHNENKRKQIQTKINEFYLEQVKQLFLQYHNPQRTNNVSNDLGKNSVIRIINRFNNTCIKRLLCLINNNESCTTKVQNYSFKLKYVVQMNFEDNSSHRSNKDNGDKVFIEVKYAMETKEQCLKDGNQLRMKGHYQPKISYEIYSEKQYKANVSQNQNQVINDSSDQLFNSPWRVFLQELQVIKSNNLQTELETNKSIQNPDEQILPTDKLQQLLKQQVFSYMQILNKLFTQVNSQLFNRQENKQCFPSNQSDEIRGKSNLKNQVRQQHFDQQRIKKFIRDRMFAIVRNKNFKQLSLASTNTQNQQLQLSSLETSVSHQAEQARYEQFVSLIKQIINIILVPYKVSQVGTNINQQIIRKLLNLKKTKQSPVQNTQFQFSFLTTDFMPSKILKICNQLFDHSDYNIFEQTSNSNLLVKIIQKSSHIKSHILKQHQTHLLGSETKTVTENLLQEHFTSSIIKHLNNTFLTIYVKEPICNREEPLVTVAVDNMKENQQLYQFTLEKLSSTVSFLVNQYLSTKMWISSTLKTTKIIKAIGILQQGSLLKTMEQNQGIKSLSNNQKSSQIVSDAFYNTGLTLTLNKGIILKNLTRAFQSTKLYAQNQQKKARKLLNLNSIISKLKKRMVSFKLSKWKQINLQINHQKQIDYLKDNVISNVQLSQNQVNQFMNSFGSLTVYKSMKHSFYKLRFYSKHHKLSCFKQYRLKCLQSTLDNLSQIFTRNSNAIMRKFFNLAKQRLAFTRKNNLLNVQKVQVFLLKLQNSRIYQRKIRSYVSQVFSLLRKKPIVLQNQQLQNTVQFVSASMDQRISQIKSFQQLSHMLKMEFPNFNIWIKPSRKYDQFIQISQGEKPQDSQFNNISFDDSAFITSRINQNSKLQQSKRSKVSKEELLSLYPQNQYSWFQTGRTIFLCRTSLISAQIILENTIVSSISQMSSNLSFTFRQKQKMHSLSKSLSQFISNYKVQLKIKLSYLNSVFEVMKTKRYSYAIKKWRKFTQNQQTLRTYQLTDTLYELNVQIEGCNQKIKQQDKQSTNQLNEYNKLLKKENQHKQRIEKYSKNIEILSKMLEHYQLSDRKQDQLNFSIRSSSKSSRKIKNQQKSYADYNCLTSQQKSAVILTLTKWRKVNQNQKYNQWELSNTIKKVNFLSRCISQTHRLLQYKLKLDSFQQMLSYSLFIQMVRQKQQQEQRERQKQILKEKLEKQALMIRQKQLRKTASLKQSELQIIQSIKKPLTMKSNLKEQGLLNTCHIGKMFEENKTLSDDNNRAENNYSEQKKSITHSLADQLQEEFNELNRRLITFQKNHLNTESQQFSSSEIYQMQEVKEFKNETEVQCKQSSIIQRDCVELSEYRPPNNSIQIQNDLQKMTEEQKIRFELQKMKMKRPTYNKQNLTVTEEEYQKLNKESAYKLGGKTLRFLKRMGKLDAPK